MVAVLRRLKPAATKLLNHQLNMYHPRMLLSGIWFRKTGFPLKQCGNDKLGNATNLIAGVIIME
jgi:hypothetical protein